MKILTFIAIHILSILSVSEAQAADITDSANSKYKSNSSQLKNLLYVRLKSDSKEDKILSELGKSSYKVERRLLSIDKSATYSQKTFDNLLSRKIDINKAKIAESKLLRTFVISYAEDILPSEQAKLLLQQFPEIEIAEPIYKQKLCNSFVPNDPLLDNQKMLETIQAYQAWDIYKGDTNVVIGIIDSGILQEHEDLAANIWINKNEVPNDGLDNDGNGIIDDYNGANLVYHLDASNPASTFNPIEGHGTGVSGISSAVSNNGKGIAGVGFNTKFFPIKTMPDNINDIVAGYEAIIYAANMGFSVVNCSWGSLSYSDVNKSIIDYALSRDLAIVAASGNHGTTEPFYPACFPGVLGVGVTNPDDKVINMSAYGAGVDIMAPGQETQTTSNTGGYGGFCCTSGASPIVAAQVALIRGLHPELDNLQAIEFARLCSDEIESKNANKYKKLIPKRINLLKSVQLNPFDTPAINYTNYTFRAKNQLENTRFSLDDTILFKINFKNYLGPADSITCKFSIVGDSINSLKVIDSILTAKTIQANSEFYIGDFSFSIERYNPETPFLRIDITSENYSDYLLIPFTPYRTYTTFSNDSIQLTACDNGRIAYNDPPNNNQGSGFQKHTKGSILYEGGFIASANGNRIVTQVRKDRNKRISDFAPIKPYLAPMENTAIFSDGFAPDSMRLGIEVESQVVFPSNSSSLVQLFIKIKKSGTDKLTDLAAGYFLDFDLGSGGQLNGAFPFTELLPPTYRDGKSLSAIVVSENTNTKVGLAVESNYPTAIPQFASFPNTETANGFPLAEQYKYINSNAKYINEVPRDISTIIGMKFPGEIQVGDSVSFIITMAIGDSLLFLRNQMWNALDPEVSLVSENELLENFIYPNPVKDAFNIEIQDLIDFQIVNILGTQKKDVSANNIELNKYVFNVESLETGIYILKISTKTQTINKIFVKQ